MKANWMQSIGMRYGMLVVQRLDETRSTTKRKYVWALCDCGSEKSMSLDHIKGGASRSCGCVNKRYSASATGRTLEFQSHCGMMARCYNKNADNYKYYGALGVTVHEPWWDFNVFYADLGPRPEPSFSLERIDVRKPYEPGNVRWASIREQSRNKTNTLYVEYQGETHKAIELCEAFGVKPSLFYSRVFQYNWSVAEALNIPKMPRGGYYKQRDRRAYKIDN